MSIMRIALRLSAVQALRGRTMVGSNVLDSEIGSLQVDAAGNLRTEEDTPFIAVYTDAATTKDIDISARSLSVNGLTTLLFEAGITAAMTETDPATDETRLIGIGTPATDQGLEFHLDMVYRQLADALTDPDNEWAQVYQGMIARLVQVERARTANADNGVRLAGHQFRVTVELLPDPVKGQPVKETSALGRFFVLAATVDDPIFSTQVALMKAQVAGDGLPWKGDLRRFGMTRYDAHSMLTMPVEGAEQDVTVTQVDTDPARIAP